MGTLDWFFPLVALLFGLLFGSFGNVVIWRYPRGESLSVPASHCPRCEHPVRWYDNVPVISWLVLRGRCRDCNEPISARYPSVELLSGLLWLGSVLVFGPSLRALASVFMCYVLLLLGFIDLDTRRLPNSLVALLGGVGALLCVVSQFTSFQFAPLTPVVGWAAPPLLAGLIGTLSAGGVSLAISSIYGGVRGRAGLGMGDVKLLAALGPFLGVFTLGVFVVGSFFGVGWGVVAARRSGQGAATKFAFGPCLAAAAVVMGFWGPTIWNVYASAVGIG
ncbi:MAG: prepilin peptidase [Actinomycetota bacterium]|nr:prepilin peptidase [Actinomycetota bacterium]